MAGKWPKFVLVEVYEELCKEKNLSPEDIEDLCRYSKFGYVGKCQEFTNTSYNELFLTSPKESSTIPASQAVGNIRLSKQPGPLKN